MRANFTILIISVCFISACSNSYDDMAYKYGNGIKDSINGASKAIACVYVGGATCATLGATVGYIEGKQQARKNIVAKDNADLIKKMADKEAKDHGVNIQDESCWFFFCN